MKVLSTTETVIAVYEFAAAALRGPLFPSPTDPPTPVDIGTNAQFEARVAATEKELLATIADAIAEGFAALRAAARAAPTIANEPQPDAGLSDLVRPMDILKDYDISRAELYRRCIDYPIGTPGGFSLRRDGASDHLISRSRFHLHYQQHPPRRRRYETKKT